MRIPKILVLTWLYCAGTCAGGGVPQQVQSNCWSCFYHESEESVDKKCEVNSESAKECESTVGKRVPGEKDTPRHGTGRDETRRAQRSKHTRGAGTVLEMRGPGDKRATVS